MPRQTKLPVTEESAERVRAIIAGDPKLGHIAVAAILHTDRRQLKKVCEAFGITITGGYKRHNIASRPVIKELFTELERRGITQKDLTHQLGRSPAFIHGVRIGIANPNLFDLECMAQLAGMKLIAVKADD